MATNYVKQLDEYSRKWLNKVQSMDDRILNSRRRLNFLYNLMRRNDFSEKDAKKATKKMDKHSVLHYYSNAIYHKNDKDHMSALTANEAIKFLHKVGNDNGDLLFNIDKKHPDKSQVLKRDFSFPHGEMPCSFDHPARYELESDVGTIKCLLGKIIDDSLSDDESIQKPASQKMSELSKWSDGKRNEVVKKVSDDFWK